MASESILRLIDEVVVAAQGFGNRDIDDTIRDLVLEIDAGNTLLSKENDRTRAERTTADVASVRWEQESGRLERENARLRAALEAVGDRTYVRFGSEWYSWNLEADYA